MVVLDQRRRIPTPSARRLKSVVRSRVAGQAAGFAVGDAASTVLGGVAAAVLAKHMTTSAYGSYAFAVALLLFLARFFEFGLFIPGARMAARSGPAARREVVGATFLAYVPIGVAFSATVFGLSFGVDQWFNVAVGPELRLLAPLALAYPFMFVSLQLAQGCDRLAGYSLSNALARIAFLGVAVALIAFDRLSVNSALMADAATLLVALVGLAAWLRPAWRGAASRLPLLVREARQYGIQMYLGRVLSGATYDLDVLMVAALTDARSVGFYTLAAAVSYLVGLPAVGMAGALFTRLTTQPRLERRWLAMAWALGLAAAAAGSLLCPPVIHVVLSPDYLPVASLLPPLALAQAIRGVTSLYNSFLTAHARGRELRNTAVLLTAANVVLNLALIPPFGAAGAAWASVLALAANLLAHQAAYRRVAGQLAEVEAA